MGSKCTRTACPSDAAEPRPFAIGGGFLQVVRDQVRVVTERGAATD
jgi:hypothetical protein